MEAKFKTSKLDYTLVMVGSLVYQKGFTYPAEITIYGDNLVLRCTESHCILRSPTVKRNVSFEPYIDEVTFSGLTRSFLAIQETTQPFCIDNGPVARRNNEVD